MSDLENLDKKNFATDTHVKKQAMKDDNLDNVHKLDANYDNNYDDGDDDHIEKACTFMTTFWEAVKNRGFSNMSEGAQTRLRDVKNLMLEATGDASWGNQYAPRGSDRLTSTPKHNRLHGIARNELQSDSDSADFPDESSLSESNAPTESKV